MERNRRIKVVAVALITVLASVAIGGFAYASSNNAAGTGTAQAYVWSKTESNFQTNIKSGACKYGISRYRSKLFSFNLYLVITQHECNENTNSDFKNQH